jgi:hypothetical protein
MLRKLRTLSYSYGLSQFGNDNDLHVILQLGMTEAPIVAVKLPNVRAARRGERGRESEGARSEGRRQKREVRIENSER